jgi:hypothetical protein
MAKYQNKNPHQPVVKSAIVLRNETQDKIEAIRRRLHEIRQYKRLIAADGLEPDQEDKRLESELIVRLLRLEKSLKPAPRPKHKPEDAEAKPAPGRRQRTPRRARGG